MTRVQPLQLQPPQRLLQRHGERYPITASIQDWYLVLSLH